MNERKAKEAGRRGAQFMGHDVQPFLTTEWGFLTECKDCGAHLIVQHIDNAPVGTPDWDFRGEVYSYDCVAARIQDLNRAYDAYRSTRQIGCTHAEAAFELSLVNHFEEKFNTFVQGLDVERQQRLIALVKRNMSNVEDSNPARSNAVNIYKLAMKAAGQPLPFE